MSCGSSASGASRRLLRVLALATVSVSGAGGAARLSRGDSGGRSAGGAPLLKQPAEVNAADPDGTTPLHWAVRADDLDLATRLVQAGATVRVANRYGVSPLSLAALNGNAAMVRLLLANGADASQRVSRGRPC